MVSWLIKTALRKVFQFARAKAKAAAVIYLAVDTEQDQGIANHSLVLALRLYAKSVIELHRNFQIPVKWFPQFQDQLWDLKVLDYANADAKIPVLENVGMTDTIKDLSNVHPGDWAWTRMLRGDWSESWAYALPIAMAYVLTKFNNAAVGEAGERTAWAIPVKKLDDYKRRYGLERATKLLPDSDRAYGMASTYAAYAILDHMSSARLRFESRSVDSDFLLSFGRVDRTTAYLMCFFLSYITGVDMIINSQSVQRTAEFVATLSFFNQLISSQPDFISEFI